MQAVSGAGAPRPGELLSAGAVMPASGPRGAVTPHGGAQVSVASTWSGIRITRWALRRYRVPAPPPP